MKSSFAIRLLGVVAVAAGAGLLYWLFIRFVVAAQASLAPSLLERLDGNPARIQTYLDDVSGHTLMTGLLALAATALLAISWLWTIERNPPYGDASARGKRGLWAGLLVLALIITAGLFWQMVLHHPIGQLIAANVGINCLGITLVLSVLSFWIATAAFVPASTRIAVPLASSVFGRR